MTDVYSKPQDGIDRDEAARLLAWWVESGVDLATSEAPRDWLKAPTAAARAQATPDQLPAPDVATAAPTTSLDAFHAWLGEAQGLPLDRPGARRVLPVGPEGAPLMLLSDLPGAEDAAEKRPLGGDSWRLAVRMLAAIGLTPDQAYLASLGCFHVPGARLDRDDLQRCGTLARQHIKLARPERLLLFGDAPCRALLGQPMAAARGKVHRVEGVRAVATFHPRWLLDRPSDKALAWRDLLLLMSEEG